MPRAAPQKPGETLKQYLARERKNASSRGSHARSRAEDASLAALGLPPRPRKTYKRRATTQVRTRQGTTRRAPRSTRQAPASAPNPALTSFTAAENTATAGSSTTDPPVFTATQPRATEPTAAENTEIAGPSTSTLTLFAAAEPTPTELAPTVPTPTQTPAPDMAPTTGAGETPEYNDFVNELIQYHERRGTTLDLQPKLENKPINLLRLYRTVTTRGGYDRVSAEKLLWRRLGQEFNPQAQNLLALGFNLKTIYYKNLAAYEISTFHEREPPPKEILELVSASGHDLLNRTVENYKPKPSRDSGALANGNDSDSDEEGRGTPKEGRMDVDDPGSGGGRARSLRQQPPQRVLWQPDTTPARQTRNASAHTYSPQPQSMPTSYSLNPSSDPNGSMFNVQAWDGPRKAPPMTVQAVVTPGNNPGLFSKRREMQGATQKPFENPPGPIIPKPRHITFAGPNIYIRCLNGLMCPIPQEQEFALHHLVKISHERGDKFRFQSFPGMVEALVHKALEISSLFYDVSWNLVYDKESMTAMNCLNGAMSTADILTRIKHHPEISPKDDIRDADFSYRLERLNEAALIIRNLCMLEDNAAYLATFPIVQDFLCIALNLPKDSRATEFKFHALEVAEVVTKYYTFTPDNPLYQSLIALLDTNDRGIFMGAAHSINRISMEKEWNSNLTGIPMSTVTQIIEWGLILRDDEELIVACLDFLYQYTANSDNVEEILKKLKPELELVPGLVSLLMYEAETVVVPVRPRVPPSRPAPATYEIPKCPKELIDELAAFPEPQRSTKWLKCCFEEKADQEVTQILLWQSYQNTFVSTPHNQMLQASDFIKGVSNTFNGANAQVINSTPPRFIIKGIQPRKRPVNLEGKVIESCLWTENGKVCGQHYVEPEEGYNHLAIDHLGLSRNEQGKLFCEGPDPAKYACRWPSCPRFNQLDPSPAAILRHAKLHLTKPTVIKEPVKEEAVRTITYRNTQVDDNRNPSGPPLVSVLILRNLARYAAKFDQGNDLMDRLFGAMKPRLARVWADNMSLAGYMHDLMMMIKGSEKPST